MRSSIVVLVALVAVLLSAPAEAADATGAGRWPGTGSAKKSTSKPPTTPASSKSKTPIISKVSDNTKRLFASKKKPVKASSGGTTIVRPKPSTPEKPGLFKSLFQPEPPPPPKTIKEWMSLKKVQP